ncbi:MAG: hypothetical protein E6G67_13960 [Actinobacteria bacterium]|nr:MAG: hypothetical protein E6G67_13960 [Actinomycetota bacterium]
MGLHVGEAARRNGDYYGPTLNRAARIMSAGHGGQVLLSAAAAALVVDELPQGSTLRDLGEHRLKDLGRTERVFQLVHADLLVSFPPLVTLSRRAHQVPDQPSSFVGRAAELKEIGERLEDESVRLLTLTGPGGIGKTRLALRAAADQVDRFEDGVLFVDLSTIRDSESVLAAIARTIGLSDTPDEPLLGELARQLRQQHVLLVLHNFEQVTAAAPTMAQLLHECPQLNLLVTSREALHVREEHLFAVPPLSLPSTARGPALASDSRTTTPALSARSVCAWTASRSRSSSQRPGSTSFPRKPYVTGWGAGCSCFAAGRGTCPRGNRRFATRSSGATSCSNRPSNGCSSCSPSFLASRLKRSRLSPVASMAPTGRESTRWRNSALSWTRA